MKKQIICIGGVLQETIYNTDNADVLTKYQGGGKNKYIAFDFGSKISSNQVWRSFGGGAMNSAVCFKSMGFNVLPISIVGDDLMGHAIKTYLSKLGIFNKNVKLSKNNNTAFSFVLNLPKAAEHIIFVSQGVLKEFKFNNKSFPRKNPDWLYLSSLRGPYAEFNLRAIFNLVRIKKINLFWNPGQQQIEQIHKYKKYFGLVNLFSINTAEAKDISKQFKLGAYSAVKVAKKLIEFGCGGVLITQGKRGVKYFDQANKYQQAANKITVKNTTGAGDAFNAGFLSSYLYNGDIKSALEFGMRNAAAVLQTIGAHDGVLTKKDL